MRIIDADALRKSVLDLPNCYNGFSDTYDKACIIDLIDEQPTIEERKKGKWIDDNEKPVGWYKVDKSCPVGWCKCSECGEWLIGSDEYLVKGNFCPHCGADMRGDGDA